MSEFKVQLIEAIVNNDIDFLINNRSRYDINERIEKWINIPILLYALSRPESDASNFILDNGADYTLTSSQGDSVVHAVVHSRALHKVKDFCNRCAVDINKQSADGVTPLLLSIRLYCFNIAKYLISIGADVNIVDETGVSPLHVAVKHNDLELVEELVSHGANLTAKTNVGHCPFALAADNNECIEIVKYLYNIIYNEKE